MFTVNRGESIAIAQESYTTCWLACYQMMYSWKGTPISTASVLDILKNAGIPLPELNQRGLLAKYYTTAAGALGLQSLKGGSLNAAELSYTLQAKGPIWITKKGTECNHNMIIIGFDGANRVRVIDPWWLGGIPVPDVGNQNLEFLNKDLAYFNDWKGANQVWP